MTDLASFTIKSQFISESAWVRKPLRTSVHPSLIKDEQEPLNICSDNIFLNLSKVSFVLVMIPCDLAKARKEEIGRFSIESSKSSSKTGYWSLVIFNDWFNGSQTGRFGGRCIKDELSKECACNERVAPEPMTSMSLSKLAPEPTVAVSSTSKLSEQTSENN